MQKDDSTFPRLVLDLVAQRLPPLDVVRLARVSRAWREQLQRTVLTERILVKQRGAPWLARNLHRTLDLELRGWYLGWDAPFDPALLSGADSLVRLCVSRSRGRCLPSLSSCRALKELQVVECKDITELPSLEALGQLTRLVVRDAMSLRHLGPLTGCKALKELTADYRVQLSWLLSLDSCTALKALDVATSALPFGLGPATGLTRLKLKYYESQALPSLYLPRLETLACHSCFRLRQLPSLAWGGALQRLSICMCDALLALPDLSSCKHLVELRCKSCPQLRQLPSLASCRELQFLRIADCSNLLALPDLGRCTRLVELLCSNCINLRDLPGLASCKELQRLHLEHCPSLHALPDLSGCTRLKELFLLVCPGLLVLPSLASCGQLRRLHVEWCFLLGLPDLSSCTLLTQLSCLFCPDLQALPDLTACTTLETVALLACAMCDAPGFYEWQEQLQSRGVLVSH